MTIPKHIPGVTWRDVMQMKHMAHIATHEHAYGARLGHLKKKPTKKQLDAAYARFVAEKEKNDADR